MSGKPLLFTYNNLEYTRYGLYKTFSHTVSSLCSRETFYSKLKGLDPRELNTKQLKFYLTKHPKGSLNKPDIILKHIATNFMCVPWL